MKLLRSLLKYCLAPSACVAIFMPLESNAQNSSQSRPSLTSFFDTISTQGSEVFINSVTIPTQGFDDNDNVEFMIEGILPNACYGISEKPRLEISFGNFTVRQFAYRKVEGPCAAPDSALKGIYGNPVPFDDVVKLGVLQKGDYKIFYQTTQSYRSRSFRVKGAPTDSIDSMNYARVENAFVPLRTFAGSPVRVVIQAALISSCQHPTKEFRLDPEDNPNDDVVVILPEVEVGKGDLCTPNYEPVEQVVLVEGLKPGRYHLHIRSFNGQSVNRIFNVF